MARLIDVDNINYHEHTECMGHGDFETVRTVTDKEIEEIPTVDAVPVVRCQDCKYSSYDEIFENRWCNSRSGCRKVKDNDFCSYGDRKDGDGNGGF